MRISDWSSDVCSSDLQATSLNLAQRPDAKHGIGHETLVARGQNVRPCPNLAAFDTKRDRQTPHALAHRAEHAAAIEYRCQQTAVMHPEQIADRKSTRLNSSH